jgi:hypothetical protein
MRYLFDNEPAGISAPKNKKRAPWVRTLHFRRMSHGRFVRFQRQLRPKSYPIRQPKQVNYKPQINE